MTRTYKIDPHTVLVIDEHGEPHDLNSGGAPCTSLAELRELVWQLYAQGAYGVATRTELLAEIS